MSQQDLVADVLLQFGTGVAAVLTSFLTALGPTPDQPVIAGEPLSGANQGYRLTVAEDGWSFMPKAQRGQYSDLELFDRTGQTVLVVYANCTGSLTLDDIVDDRRSMIAPALSDLEVTEDRRFDAVPFVPVSTARYSGLEKEGRRTFWVSTAVDGRLQVEAIVTLAGDNAEDEAVAKAVIGSLEILGEEKGCGTG